MGLRRLLPLVDVRAIPLFTVVRSRMCVIFWILRFVSNNYAESI